MNEKQAEQLIELVASIAESLEVISRQMYRETHQGDVESITDAVHMVATQIELSRIYG